MKTMIRIIGFVLIGTLAGQASNAGSEMKNKTEDVRLSKTNPSSEKKSTKSRKASKKSPHSTVKRSKI